MKHYLFQIYLSRNSAGVGSDRPATRMDRWILLRSASKPPSSCPWPGSEFQQSGVRRDLSSRLDVGAAGLVPVPDGARDRRPDMPSVFVALEVTCRRFWWGADRQREDPRDRAPGSTFPRSLTAMPAAEDR